MCVSYHITLLMCMVYVCLVCMGVYKYVYMYVGTGMSGVPEMPTWWFGHLSVLVFILFIELGTLSSSWVMAFPPRLSSSHIQESPFYLLNTTVPRELSHTPNIYVSSGGLSSGPLTSSLTTEISPKHPAYYFYMYFRLI